MQYAQRYVHAHAYAHAHAHAHPQTQAHTAHAYQQIVHYKERKIKNQSTDGCPPMSKAAEMHKNKKLSAKRYEKCISFRATFWKKQYTKMG